LSQFHLKPLYNFFSDLFGRRKFTLIGHRAEISTAQFNYDGSLIATASMDQTAKLWDSRTGQVIATLRAHEDEVLDAVFDYTGKKLATASADGMYVQFDLAQHTTTG
jgi:dynein assembly factor with WDR repeat domains 1